jgi:hypothetical protein
MRSDETNMNFPGRSIRIIVKKDSWNLARTFGLYFRMGEHLYLS